MPETLTAASEDVLAVIKPSKASPKPGKLFIGGEFVDALETTAVEWLGTTVEFLAVGSAGVGLESSGSSSR